MGIQVREAWAATEAKWHLCKENQTAGSKAQGGEVHQRMEEWLIFTLDCEIIWIRDLVNQIQAGEKEEGDMKTSKRLWNDEICCEGGAVNMERKKMVTNAEEKAREILGLDSKSAI